LDGTSNAVTNVRALQSRVFLPLVSAFTPTPAGLPAVNQWIQTHNVQKTWLTQDLPINVDLMTFQIVETGGNLLRLSHQFAVGEDPVLSQPVTVNLATLFNGIPLNNLTEVSLTANQPASEIEKNMYKWNTIGPNANVNLMTYPLKPFDGISVTINPMDIRTFTFTTN